MLPRIPSHPLVIWDSGAPCAADTISAFNSPWWILLPSISCHLIEPKQTLNSHRTPWQGGRQLKRISSVYFELATWWFSLVIVLFFWRALNDVNSCSPVTPLFPSQNSVVFLLQSFFFQDKKVLIYSVVPWMEALLCLWSSSIAFLCSFSISSVSYLRLVNQDCTIAFKRWEPMDLYSSIMISSVLLPTPNNS